MEATEAPDPAGRRDGWIVLGVAVALRGLYLLSLLSDRALASLRSVDTVAYLEQVRQLLAGHWSAPASFHSALVYPYLLAALGGNATAALVLQSLLDAASAVLVWRLGRRAGRLAGMAAGLLYATAAVAIFGAGTLLFDSIGVFLVLAGAECAAVAHERPSARGWVASGALIALAASARPFLLAFPPVLLWRLSARRGLRPGEAGLALGAVALGAALVLAPIGLVSRATTGELRLFPASGGITFYIGNNPLADGTLVVPPQLGVGADYAEGALAHPARRLGRAVTAGEASAFWFREGLAFWRDEPLRALAITGRKVALLANVAEIPDNYDFAIARERLALLRWLPGWLPVLALAPWGVAAALRRRELLTPLAMAAIHALALPLFLATGRLRHPLMALLCVFAGLAVAELRQLLRARERRRGALALASVAVASTVALWPLLPAWGSPAPGSLRQLAAALVESSRPEEALEVLDRIPEAGRRSAWGLRGDALHALGRDQEALAAYRRAVGHDRRDDAAHRRLEALAAALPADPEEVALVEAARSRGDAAAWLALARRRIAEERFEVAIRAARAALRAGAGDEGTYLLAVALRGRGRPAESVDAFGALLARSGRSAPLLVDSGHALFDDGRLEEAHRHFEEALALDPRSVPALYGLALVEKASGRIAAARERYLTVVAIEPPGSAWSEDARRQLRELERR